MQGQIYRTRTKGSVKYLTFLLTPNQISSINNAQKIYCILFRPVKTLKDFLATVPVKSFNKDEILAHQGDASDQIYIVKKGIIRCYDISSEGNQQLIWLLSKDEIFPFTLLFDIDEKIRFFYSAFSDAEVYIANKKELADFLKSNPTVLYEICTEMTRKFDGLHHRVNATGKPKAREKILYTLAFIADRFQSDEPQTKQVELSLPLTHQDIADLVGLTRETAATTLKQLKDENFIDYENQRFIVYRDKIEKALW